MSPIGTHKNLPFDELQPALFAYIVASDAKLGNRNPYGVIDFHWTV
jgi:hypothetical protein